MTTSPALPAPACHTEEAAGAHAPLTGRRRMWKLTVHYVEMVIAMAVGMVALHPVWTFAFDALGWSAVLDRPEPMALVMATNMTVAMSAWMKFRGHGWRSIVEMGAAMYLPFIVLFVPLWAGFSARTECFCGATSSCCSPWLEPWPSGLMSTPTAEPHPAGWPRVVGALRATPRPVARMPADAR